MKLLEHNLDLYNKIVKKMKKYHDICIVQGTGGGKSYLLMYLIIEIFKDKKVAVVTPTEDIQKGIMQYKEFREVEDNITFFTNHYFNSLERDIEVAENYDVVFMDEVHHIGSDLFGKNLQKVKELMVKENKYFFGLTATPIRSSDNVDVKNLFSASVTGYSAFDFIQMGLMPQIEYLICEPEAIEKAKKEEYKEVIDYENSIDLLKDIIKSNNKKKWLCYFSSIKDLKSHRDLIKSLFPDHKYIEIYNGSEHSSEEFKTFKNKDKVVICSVSKLLEGIHLSGMEGILLFRNVKSSIVFEQILGRLLSINSKTSPLFIDCTKSASRLLHKLLHTKNIQYINSPSVSINMYEPRDIIKISLRNKKYFNISQLLMNLSNSEFEFRGIIYPSFLECCRKFQVPPANVYSYINKGMTKEEALEYCIENVNKFIVDGVNYNTCKNACKAFNISYEGVYSYKLRYNCPSLLEAFNMYRDKYVERTEIFRGIKYENRYQCCKAFNVDYSNVSRKMNKDNISFSDALEYYIEYHNKKYIPKWNGKTYSSEKEMYKDLGVNPEAVRRYIRLYNISKEEAIQKALDNKPEFTFRGVIYPSYNNCCQSFGINTSSVFSRCQKLGGVSKQEGLESLLQERGL